MQSEKASGGRPIFQQVEPDQDGGNVRIENVVKYLPSIQQKSGLQDSMRIMTAKCEKRAFRIIVWASRVIGWALISLSIVSFLEIGTSSSLRLVSSVALGLLAIVWVVGLELFLRFFDKFLSRN